MLSDWHTKTPKMIEDLIIGDRKYSARRFTLGEYKGQVSGVDVEEAPTVNHQIVDYINRYELIKVRDWITELLNEEEKL